MNIGKKMFFRSLVGDAAWARLRRLSWAPRHRLERICRAGTAGVVSGGPFSGMVYVEDSVSGAFIPKLTGPYERELHGVVEEISRDRVDRVINIGAAEGYYAVGLCRRIPRIRVVAFETESRGRRLIARMASRNGVEDRIEIRGTCGPNELEAALGGSEPARTLVLIDVEGYETVLLDPARIPALRHCPILLEVHDVKVPGISITLRSRFEESHEIETIWQEKRTAADFPFINAYTERLERHHLEAAMDEGRPVRDGVTPMCWFWMTPKQECSA